MKCMEATRILIVDDHDLQRRLLCDILQPLGYECDEAEDGVVALERIRASPFDLIIADVRMPRMDGFELLGHLIRASYDIPVIIMAAEADLGSAGEALKMGAYDYLPKPIDMKMPPYIVARALEHHRLRRENLAYRTHLEHQVEERTAELRAAYQQILHALGAALEWRDPETQEHAERVTLMTVTVAQELGIHGQVLRDMQWGALLHDVGKIGIPDAILLKPGPLTPEEQRIMRSHVQKGYRMLEPIAFLKGALPIILHHHERWDGTGYPMGLKGEAIPIGARIFAIADAFDAITSERPYKPAFSHEVAFAEIRECAGSHFDPEIVAVFLQIYQQESLIQQESLMHDENAVLFPIAQAKGAPYEVRSQRPTKPIFPVSIS